MSRPRYCYWSVADGDYSRMFAATIKSARQAGVFKDFHLWTDRPVAGAICHEAGQFESWGCLFKLTFLRDAVRHLNYDYFVWLDTDTWFVRNPGDVLRVLAGSPMHIALESDVCLAANQRPAWWDCPNGTFAALMRAKGVRSHSIFNTNGGMFIVHRDVIETVFNLAFDSGSIAKQRDSRSTTSRCLPMPCRCSVETLMRTPSAKPWTSGRPIGRAASRTLFQTVRDGGLSITSRSKGFRSILPLSMPCGARRP